MKIESHKESLEEHKSVLFKWAIDVQGLEKSQRIVGLHASRAAVDLLSIFLHRNKLIDEGFQLNHRWFKSEKVAEKLPNFINKKTVIGKMIGLENLCEILTYGSPKPVEKTEEALNLLKEIEKLMEKEK